MTANGKIYARLFDSNNQYTNTATGTVQNIDKLDPTTATIASSNIEQTMFTLTATGVDATATSTNAMSGIEKYEFYINDTLENTVTSTAGTATLNVTGKTASTTYTCKVRVYDKAGNYKDSTTITVTTKSANLNIGEINKEENLTIDGKTEGSYNNPIVPKGFAPINESEAIWGSDTGWQNGLVIQDENGNQFVWVPVDGTNIKFERFDWGKHIDTPFSGCSEIVPDTIKNSISKYGGFYIARYEAGNASNVLVSKKGVNPWNNINWNNSKSKAEGMYQSSNTNYGVVSTLIYGTQWDATLKFIGAYGGDTQYPYDSTGKGYYVNDPCNPGNPRTCGSSTSYMKKNIYDMAGNVGEWTMEQYGTNRVIRGGGYTGSGSVYPASVRGSDYVDNANSAYGFRVGLYIK